MTGMRIPILFIRNLHDELLTLSALLALPPPRPLATRLNSNNNRAKPNIRFLGSKLHAKSLSPTSSTLAWFILHMTYPAFGSVGNFVCRSGAGNRCLYLWMYSYVTCMRKDRLNS